MKKLDGKVVLVTGASSGIGQASVRLLAAEGAKFVLTARRAERLDSLLAEVRKLGGDGVAVLGDARDEATALACVDAAKKLGGLDILINNVGVGNYKNLADTSLDDYVEMMDVNMRSTFLFARHVVPTMIAQKSGLILMISSMAGVYGFPGEAVYCATKFAVRAISDGLRQETDRIRVTVISPGTTTSELADTITDPTARDAMKAFRAITISPEAIANSVLYAVSQPDDVDVSEIIIRPTASPH
jgi:NADP-dependent 3-hydroxy acid dehydrogenase YdfG